MKRTNKANGIRSAVPRLTDYMRSSMGVILMDLILAALSAVMTILGPNQIGRIATLMSDGLMGSIDLAAIAKVGIFLAVIYGLSALFGFAHISFFEYLTALGLAVLVIPFAELAKLFEKKRKKSA